MSTNAVGANGFSGFHSVEDSTSRPTPPEAHVPTVAARRSARPVAHPVIDIKRRPWRDRTAASGLKSAMCRSDLLAKVRSAELIEAAAIALRDEHFLFWHAEQLQCLEGIVVRWSNLPRTFALSNCGARSAL